MKRARVEIHGRGFGDRLPPQPFFVPSITADPTRRDPPWLTAADRAMPEDTCKVRLYCRYDGVCVNFWRWQDFKYFLWVMGQPNMPRGYRLTGKEKPGTAGNRHWLSRWPTRFRPWAFRRGLVAFMTGPHPAIRRYLDWHLTRGGTPPELSPSGALIPN